MLRWAAASAIGLYQVHVSPRKGYACAYRIHTGRCSCSQYAKRLVLKAGVLALPEGMKRQFARCKAAFLALQALGEEAERKRRRKQGQSSEEESGCGGGLDDCDPTDCAPCEMESCEVGACDWSD
jgi:putative component of membrane protein insertase Oxa1/YidC/SpoIIIJ protein YidD